MVAIPTGLAINTAVSGDRTTPSGMRKAMAGLVQQSVGGTPAPGILYAPGTPLNVTTSASAMQYDVSAGFAVTTRTSQGAYIVGTVANVSITGVAVGNATNPRIDVIYIVQPDPELAESGVARIDVAVGTPAASPSVPAIPTGALELGRKLVPAGAANTSTGTAITNKPAYTGANTHWSIIQGKPSTFPPDVHTHTVSQITDLTTNGDVAKVLGNRITVQATAPTTPAPTTNDLWFY